MTVRTPKSWLFAALLCAVALVAWPVLATDVAGDQAEADVTTDTTSADVTDADTTAADTTDADAPLAGLAVAVDPVSGAFVQPEPKFAVQMQRETARMIEEALTAAAEKGKMTLPVKAGPIANKSGVQGYAMGIGSLNYATVTVAADGSLVTSCDDPAPADVATDQAQAAGEEQ